MGEVQQQLTKATARLEIQSPTGSSFSGNPPTGKGKQKKQASFGSSFKGIGSLSFLGKHS